MLHPVGQKLAASNTRPRRGATVAGGARRVQTRCALRPDRPAVGRHALDGNAAVQIKFQLIRRLNNLESSGRAAAPRVFERIEPNFRLLPRKFDNALLLRAPLCAANPVRR
jgi:hypothetical protein